MKSDFDGMLFQALAEDRLGHIVGWRDYVGRTLAFADHPRRVGDDDRFALLRNPPFLVEGGTPADETSDEDAQCE